MKSKEVYAVWGISPENYPIGNVRMKVGIECHSQITLWQMVLLPWFHNMLHTVKSMCAFQDKVFNNYTKELSIGSMWDKNVSEANCHIINKRHF